AYKTEGGVVSPGAEILQIVPMDEQLIVTAKISVVDVDIVETGQTARVRFSAFPARTVPEVEGEVLAISAYRKMDEASGKVHYEVRVGADLGALTQMEPPLTVVPGMPAEVLIVTETRTLLDYLLEPIESAIRRGMRET
ncbi:MAG: HlyD family efflux transporter periplasmic adaptor subunit, partial [Pseudomonadota bacterium]